MELAKQEGNKQLTPVEKVSQNDIVQVLAIKKFDHVASALPKKIQGTFEVPKIREMILATGEKTVQGFVEFELIKLAERINVSGNLTDGQVEFIASQLIGLYPNETIADFKLCFEGISVGQYIKQDKLFKLDGTEIGYAMKVYLERKYEVMEADLMKEKDNDYKRVASNTDWLQVWKESIEKTDKEGGVKTTSRNLYTLARARGLSEYDIKTGKPTGYTAYPSTSLEAIQEKDLHIQYIRENYDPYTGKPKPNWIDEKKWREALHQVPPNGNLPKEDV